MAFPTQNQRKILDAGNVNIAVSASAGSGKTTIMVERIANFISQKQVPVKNMLIVTFTNSASAEMKERLQNKLAKDIAEEQNLNKRRFLIKQAENIENANICTIDKFCINVLRKFYYLLDIDGNFEILDDIEHEKLKTRAFNMVLNQTNAKNGEKLQLICDMFLEKRNFDHLKALVNSIFNYVEIQEDREKFLNEDVFSLYNKNILKSSYYLTYVEDIKDYCEQNIHRLKMFISTNEENDKTYKMLKNYETISMQLTKSNISEFHNILANVTLETLGNKRAEMKDEIRLYIETFKKFVKNYDEVFSLKKTIKELDIQVQKSKEMLFLLIDFVKSYAEKLFELKTQNSVYSFADIEYMAYKILKNSDVKELFTEEIELIFVDEYQDVNKLQEYLINQIARLNNLFLVGDIKQSIYGFRLSEPKYFEQKLEQFEDKNNVNSEMFNLNENFRSDKQILNFINKVFDKCMTKELSGVDYATDSRLIGDKIYKNKQNKKKVQIVLSVEKQKEEEEKRIYSVKNHSCQASIKSEVEAEAQVVVDKVIEMLGTMVETSDGVYEMVNFKDIAILFRGNTPLYKRVGELLIDRGVPVNMRFKEDIYNSLEARFLNCYLELFLYPQNDIALAGVLNFPCMNCDENDLLTIAKESGESFYSKVFSYVKNYDNELSKTLQDVLNFINYGRQFAITHNVYELYCEIIKKYDLENFLLSLPNGKVYISNLKRILNSVSSSNVQNLAEYINFLKNRAEINKDITLPCDDNSVILTTIHASKGLEYKVVILAGTNKDMVRKSTDSLIFSEQGIGVDYLDLENRTKLASPVKKHLRLLVYKKETEEEKRLLYVALTRAKYFLIITGAIKEKNSDEMLKDMLKERSEQKSYLGLIFNAFDQLTLQALTSDDKFAIEGDEIEIELVKDWENELDTSFSEDADKDCAVYDTILQDNLQNYLTYKYQSANIDKISAKSSVSAILQTYSDIGATSFNIEPNKLQIDESVNTSAQIGTNYHKALELLHFEDREVDVKDVEDVLDKMQKEGFDVSELNKNKICNLANNLRNIIPQNAHIKKEQSFIMHVPYSDVVQSVIDDKVLIQGVIDLLIVCDNYCIVIDYKDSKYSQEEKLVNKYRKQLELYALATKHALQIDSVYAYIASIESGKLIKVI